MDKPYRPLNTQTVFHDSLEVNKALIEKFNFANEKDFTLNGVDFEIDTTQDRVRNTLGKLSLSKQLLYFKAYFDQIDLPSMKNIFEIGFFRGGSAAFFFELLQPKKLVTVELRNAVVPEFDMYHKASPLRQERLKTYFGINQADKPKLEKIYADEFGDDPIDLVIDDASHLYEPTKASFEVLFPRMRAGGIYVIEDWGWAHRPGRFQQEGGLWSDQSALSNFMFELTMMHATNPGWFERIVLFPFMAIVVAGERRPDPGFSVDASIVARGKKLSLI